MVTQHCTENQYPSEELFTAGGDSAPQGTPDNNWAHFSLSHLGEGTWGATVIQQVEAGAAAKRATMHRAGPTMGVPAHDTRSAQVENPSLRITAHVGKEGRILSGKGLTFKERSE